MPWGGILGVLLIAYLWAPEFAGSGGNGLIVAGVFAVALYASILVHELAHAWTAQRFGFPVHGITLWLLGGYTVYERTGSKPGRDLVISLAGPLTTLALAGLFWVMSSLTSGVASDVLLALALTNVLLGVLNLLPGAPLDGGALVKSTVWKLSGSEMAGARAAAFAGIAIAGLLAVGVVYLFLQGSSLVLVNLLLVGFIAFGAWQSLRSTKSRTMLSSLGPRVQTLVRPVLAVAEQESLGDALRRWDTQRQVAVVSVDQQGALSGALSLPAVEAVPMAARESVEVRAFTVAIPAEDRSVLGPEPEQVIYDLARSGKSMVFVTDAGNRPLGVLMAVDVNAALDTL